MDMTNCVDFGEMTLTHSQHTRIRLLRRISILVAAGGQNGFRSATRGVREPTGEARNGQSITLSCRIQKMKWK